MYKPSSITTFDLAGDWSVTPSYSEVGASSSSTETHVKQATTKLKRRNVSHARKTSPDHIKRPRNAFILFRSHTVAENLIPKEVEKDHRNISRIISHMWKSLDDSERAKWTHQALQEKEEHKKLYPDYKYKPTVRPTSVTRRNVKKLENGDEECQEIADVILKAQGRGGVVTPKEEDQNPKKRRGMKGGNQRARKIKRRLSDNHISTADVPGAVRLYSPTKYQFKHTCAAFGSERESMAASHQDSTSGIEAVSSENRRHTSAMQPSVMPPLIDSNAGSLSSTQPIDTRDIKHSTVMGADVGNFASQPSDADAGASSKRCSKPRPLPIFSTWKMGFEESVQTAPQISVNESIGRSSDSSLRPPSTTRAFFNPWVSDPNNNPMLVSPMRSTIRDLRRSSSLTGFRSVFRPLFGADAHQISVPPAHALDMFEEAAREAAANLQAEDDEVPIDPTLQYPGATQHTPESSFMTRAASLTRDFSRDTRWSPRSSFCGSTLAAAARDWTNRNTARGTDPATQHQQTSLTISCEADTMQTEPPRQEEPDAIRAVSQGTFKSSIEQAVSDLLQVLECQLGDKDQSTAITQDVLASLSAHLLSGREAQSWNLDACAGDCAHDQTPQHMLSDDAARLCSDKQPERNGYASNEALGPVPQYAPSVQIAPFHF